MTRRDVERLIERSERFVLEHLELFEPLEWSDRRRTETLRKSFIELGLFEYTRRLSGDPIPPVRAHLLDRVNDRRYAELFDRYPTLFRTYALPAVTARLSGDLCERTERAVDGVLRGEAVWGVERPPNSLLELLTEAELWGYHAHGYDLETVVAHSAVGHPPDPIEATLGDYYALTHSVFIPTNMGWGHPRLLDPPLPYDLGTTITAGVLRGVAAGHSDVVAELLVTGAIQEALHPTVLGWALRWLVAEQSTPAGLLAPEVESSADDPADLAVPMDQQEAEAWSGERERWLKRYHVNVVAGYACSYLRDQGVVGGSEPTGAPADSETFEALETLGQTLRDLHSYDLRAAAERIQRVDERWLLEFEPLTDRILGFFEAQDRGDGIGYWPDERRLFALEHGDPETFERELVAPTAAPCRAAIERLRRIKTHA